VNPLPSPPPSPERVVVYIDGFNLYFGLKSKGWKRFYWLDVHALSQGLLKPNQQLMAVKYFTSRVSASPSDPDQARRQGIYLEALSTLADTSIYFGHYLSKSVRCHSCGAQWAKHDEKMTDVNIATELLVDAFQDRYDTALLVSADSDLVGPIIKVRSLFPAKRIVAVFPPDRVSERLRREANSAFNLGRSNIAQSQLQDPVKKPDGFLLQRPSTWA
jgi:hypothetical protein